MTTLPRRNNPADRKVRSVPTCKRSLQVRSATGYASLASSLAFIGLAIGCAAKFTPTPDASIASSNAGGRITARAEFIEEAATGIVNVSIGTPAEAVKPQAESIRTQAVKIQADQTDADKANADARKAFQAEINRLGNELLFERIDRARLESRWYVRVGKFVDGWVKFLAWAIPLGWLASGIAAIFLPSWLPVGGLGISKAIVRFLPFMNWVSPIRDGMLKRKAGK